MKRLAHMGKQPLKFTFEMYVCDVRGLPNDVGQISLSWERNGKPVAQSAPVATELTGEAERLAKVDEKLRVTVTLYRNSKRATFESKPSILKLLDMSAGP